MDNLKQQMDNESAPKPPKDGRALTSATNGAKSDGRPKKVDWDPRLWRRHISAKSDCVDFLIRIVAGEKFEAFGPTGKSLGALPAKLETRVAVARFLTNKIAPDLATVEVIGDAEKPLIIEDKTETGLPAIVDLSRRIAFALQAGAAAEAQGEKLPGPAGDMLDRQREQTSDLAIELSGGIVLRDEVEDATAIGEQPLGPVEAPPLGFELDVAGCRVIHSGDGFRLQGCDGTVATYDDWPAAIGAVARMVGRPLQDLPRQLHRLSGR